MHTHACYFCVCFKIHFSVPTAAFPLDDINIFCFFLFFLTSILFFLLFFFTMGNLAAREIKFPSGFKAEMCCRVMDYHKTAS